MNKRTLKTALEAEPTDRIECPVCGDEIPAFELTTDHTHPRELLELVVDLLPEATDEQGLREGYEAPADRDPWVQADSAEDLLGQHSGSSASTTDDYYGEGSGKRRETVIRYDPEHVTSGELRERLREIDEIDTQAETQSLPERRVFSVGDETDYERIAEAAWGVANAFVGSSLHAGHELVACSEWESEGHIEQAVFPGGTDHDSDEHTEDP